jgi:hypothetical protein
MVEASWTLNISFKHTTGDYLDAEQPLKPLEKSLMKLQRNLQQQKYNLHVTCTVKSKSHRG